MYSYECDVVNTPMMVHSEKISSFHTYVRGVSNTGRSKGFQSEPSIHSPPRLNEVLAALDSGIEVSPFDSELGLHAQAVFQAEHL